MRDWHWFTEKKQETIDNRETNAFQIQEPIKLQNSLDQSRMLFNLQMESTLYYEIKNIDTLLALKDISKELGK